MFGASCAATESTIPVEDTTATLPRAEPTAEISEEDGELIDTSCQLFKKSGMKRQLDTDVWNTLYAEGIAVKGSNYQDEVTNVLLALWPRAPYLCWG